MGANETVFGKHKFEQWVFDLASVCVKEYHSDNGVYDSAFFEKTVLNKTKSKHSVVWEQSTRTL